MSFFDVDFNKVTDDSVSYQEGKYLLKVIESTIVRNSKGNGHHLLLKLENTTKPPLKVSYRINIKNDNEVAQRIGLSQLSNIFSLMGFTKDQMNYLDNTILLNNTFEILLKNKEFDGKKYLEVNKILSHIPVAQQKSSEMPNW